MVKYRLIQLYPGSEPLGYILKPVNKGLSEPGIYYQNGIWFSPSDYPKYWQEVKELSLLEEAKLRYPIGTKFRSVQHEGCYHISNNIYESTYFNLPIIYCEGVTLYYKDKWAEIIDDFVLPEKWCIKQNTAKEVCDWFNKNGTNAANINGSWKYLNYPYIDGYYSSEIKSGCTEITFEQFKKYVLKEETTVNVEEKVVEKDYEILSYIHNGSKHIWKKDPKFETYFYINQGLNPCTRLEDILKYPKIYLIHSVKRNDGEIFTIGDKVNCHCLSKIEINNTFITSFNIINNNVRVYDNFNEFHLLKDIQKAKQPLFITEDGVDIFEGDYSYGVHNSKFDIVAIKHINTVYVTDNFIEFSTKEAAEEYILMNKPLLSLSDIYDNLKVKDQKEVLKFVKSKLNK